jgi:N-methylhydantoinase B
MVATIEPMLGGSGAAPFHDGANGAGGNLGFLENTPIEMNEAEMPIKILKYELVTDSGGAGKYRGGLGTILEFQVFSPNDTITARNRDRVKFRPWGVLGGKAGKASWFTVNKGTKEERNLGNIDFASLIPGDIVSIVSSGGGGWGSPLDRDPDMVLADVQRGFVSEVAAKSEYGVVIKDDAVDIEATENERFKMRQKENDNLFDFGPEREDYEKLWTKQTYDALTDVLDRVPISWKSFVKSKIFESMERNRGISKDPVTDLYEVFGVLTKKFPIPIVSAKQQ